MIHLKDSSRKKVNLSILESIDELNFENDNNHK